MTMVKTTTTTPSQCQYYVVKPNYIVGNIDENDFSNVLMQVGRHTYLIDTKFYISEI